MNVNSINYESEMVLMNNRISKAKQSEKKTEIHSWFFIIINGWNELNNRVF